MGGSGSRYSCSDEVFNMVGLGTDGGQARSDLRRFVERQLCLSCASGPMVDTIAVMNSLGLARLSRPHEVGSVASGKALPLFLSVVTLKAKQHNGLF
jgi:hypothetical protein